MKLILFNRYIANPPPIHPASFEEKVFEANCYFATEEPFLIFGYDIAVFPPGHGVSVFEIIDVDKDDYLEIVACNLQGDAYLLENPYPRPESSRWRKYKVTAFGIGSGHDFREIDVGDLENDGNYDIIVADEGQNKLIWFENAGETFYENWEFHIVDKSDEHLRWSHSVSLGDIDGDGDLDIAVVAGAGINTFLIYFNDVKEKTFK